MNAVYADPATNDGSIFSDHLVLVWTAGGHTYALGFHVTRSRHKNSDCSTRPWPVVLHPLVELARIGDNQRMSSLARTAAPWSAAFGAFLGGAATAAGVIPAVFYDASDDATAILVVVCGLLVTPFGAFLGIWLKDRF